MTKEIRDTKKFKTEAPFTLFGLAIIDGRYHCLSALCDTHGKIGKWKTHYRPEIELEFAQDQLKKVLAHEGVRF